MNFTDFKLNEKILAAVEREGYVHPTPIQEQAIPIALEGRDILGCAQTGTGKTAAFSLPVLEHLSKGFVPNANKRTIRALILTPTRELAIQIHDSLKKYGRYLKLKSGVVMGGVSQYLQRDIIEHGTDILVATPGRLLDYLQQKMLNIDNVEIFVLDEADRMLDMGFIHDVKKIIAYLPKKRQTFFFSATMPSDVMKLANSLLYRPESIAVAPVSSTLELTSQTVYYTDKLSKNDLLVWLLRQQEADSSTLIFTRTKHGADRLTRKLKQAGIAALAIHGDKSQGARQNALESFKKGQIKVLIATDIAARGIDIDGISYVINYEIPNVPETYVHRIGRTGRAGKTGVAISLCDFDEKEYVADIEKLTRKKLMAASDNPYPMTVFTKSPPKVPSPRPPRSNYKNMKNAK